MTHPGRRCPVVNHPKRVRFTARGCSRRGAPEAGFVDDRAHDVAELEGDDALPAVGAQLDAE